MKSHPRPASRAALRAVPLVLGATLCLFPAVAHADVPFAGDEVAKIQSFLSQASMVAGKTNAQLMGADPANPATWSGVSWTATIPNTNPPEPLDNRHVLHIDLRGSFAGNADFSGFPYMQTCSIDNSYGSVGNRGNYSAITITGNDMLTGIYLQYVSAGAIAIAGNPALKSVQIAISDAGGLSLTASGLLTLRTTTLGNTPIGLAGFPSLTTLDLSNIDNLASLNLGGCPLLEYVSASYMGTLQNIQFGSRAQLLSVIASNNPQLASLDVRASPELRSLYCSDNLSLTTLHVGGNPKLEYVEVNDNHLLAALDLSNLPALGGVRCSSNETLATLLLRNDPVLDFVLCGSNALTTLDISDSSALKTLMAGANKLRRFDNQGPDFDMLDLIMNELQEIIARVAGRQIHLRVHGDGGYAGFYARPDPNVPADTWVSFHTVDLPEPRNTRIDRIAGTGVPEDWRDNFRLAGSIDATAYFTTGVVMVEYYEDPADNPLGEWFGTARVEALTVGDPIPDPANDDPPPTKTGYFIEGWYTDEEFTDRWHFGSDILTGELYLYPNWRQVGAPIVTAVDRLSPAAQFTSATTLTWHVTFSESVTGIDAGDFVLTTTAGLAAGTVTTVSAGSGLAVDVTVTNLTGSGTLRLDALGGGIADLEGTLMLDGFNRGQPYTIGGAGALGEFLQSRGIDPQSPAGAATADPDGDTLDNLLEFTLGGNPQACDPALLPTATRLANGPSPVLQFTHNFTTTAEAHFQADTEYSANLTSWTTAIDGQDGVTITSLPSLSGRTVTVLIPAGGPRLFARLRVVPK